MSRTTITARDDRHVTITFVNWNDEPVTMEIWAPTPAAGGYTYVRLGDGQLCERLSTRGVTLMYYAGTKLVDIVRREYKAMRAAEKRAASKEFSV